MKISTKIYLSYLFLAILVGVTQFVEQRAFSFARTTFNKISTETTPMLRAIEDFRAAGLLMLSSTGQYVMLRTEDDGSVEPAAATDAAAREQEEFFRAETGLFNNAIKRIKAHIQAKSTLGHTHMIARNDLGLLLEKGNLLRDRCERLVRLKKSGAATAATLELQQELRKAKRSFLAATGSTLKKETEVLELHRQNLFNAINRALDIVKIAGLAALGLIIFFGLAITRAVSTPIRALMNSVAEIGRGRLEARAPIISRDEIGQLATAFNKMAGDLAVALDKEKKAIQKATAASVAAEQEHKRATELQEIIKIRDQEIAKRKEYQKKLDLAAEIIENTIEGIVLTDPDGVIEQVNPGFTAITGYGPAEVLGQTPHILMSAHHKQRFYEDMWNTLLAHGSWRGEIWSKRKSGEVYPQWLSITVLKDQEGETTHYVGLFHDISELKKSQQRLEYMAYYDTLTGLPNRTLFSNRLEKAFTMANRGQQMIAIVYLDIDDFKNINDTLGHNIGDLFLREAARVLNGFCRNEDTVARTGGDDFLFMFQGVNDIDGAATIVRRILAAFETPFQVQNHELFVSASAGITVYPDDGKDVETLIRNADMAMYGAKEAGKKGFCFFTRKMDETLKRRMILERSLRKALEQEEFRVYYQPKLSVAGGRIEGAEALVRWQRSDGSIVSPLDFIPLAEQTGLIVPLGQWVLRTACRQTRAWQEAGFPIKIAVNLSARQFQQKNLMEMVEQALVESGLAPVDLELEVTESILLASHEEAVEILSRLREMGVSVAIDDFGTGYSSLSYLKKLPIDTIKIDRAFIRDIPGDTDDVAITRAILAMSHSLGLRVVAEGVESNDHLLFLREHGCESMQGYLFSPPVPAADFLEILRQKKRLVPPTE
ncbi:MAG: EAL domain-containing protein [Desulfobacterales bacterium]|nr:EAL domain-containing protein [Desulfobacterales bacterium]